MHQKHAESKAGLCTWRFGILLSPACRRYHQQQSFKDYHLFFQVGTHILCVQAGHFVCAFVINTSSCNQYHARTTDLGSSPGLVRGRAACNTGSAVAYSIQFPNYLVEQPALFSSIACIATYRGDAQRSAVASTTVRTLANSGIPLLEITLLGVRASALPRVCENNKFILEETISPWGTPDSLKSKAECIFIKFRS